MKTDFIGRSGCFESPLRRLPAFLKLFFALGVIVMTAVPVFASPVFLAGIAVFLAGVVVAGRVPLFFLLRRLLMLEPVVLGIALMAIFQAGGWRMFFSILVRSNLCLVTVILLSVTTSLPELLSVLKRAHVPPLMTTTLALMYRYLFVLLEEGSRMRNARASRTFTRGRALTWRLLGTVISQLFVRSTERAERIYAAMCARGWR